LNSEKNSFIGLLNGQLKNELNLNAQLIKLKG